MIKQLTGLLTPLAAIAAIVILELKALTMGIDGTLLAGVVAVLGGLGGYGVKKVKDLIKKVN